MSEGTGQRSARNKTRQGNNSFLPLLQKSVIAKGPALAFLHRKGEAQTCTPPEIMEKTYPYFTTPARSRQTG